MTRGEPEEIYLDGIAARATIRKLLARQKQLACDRKHSEILDERARLLGGTDERPIPLAQLVAGDELCAIAACLSAIRRRNAEQRYLKEAEEVVRAQDALEVLTRYSAGQGVFSEMDNALTDLDERIADDVSRLSRASPLARRRLARKRGARPKPLASRLPKLLRLGGVSHARVLALVCDDGVPKTKKARVQKRLERANKPK